MNDLLKYRQFQFVNAISFSARDYAIVEPNKIIFVLDANKKEIGNLLRNEEIELKKKYFCNSVSVKNNKNTSVITFLPTMDCNLRCVYCYARGGDAVIEMPISVAFASLDALAKQTGDRNLVLKFAGGGEPFMNFGLMQKVCKYAKNLFSEVSIGIVTNGTFGSEQLQWILENDVSLRISFDGLAHEKQRPFYNGESSLQIVENNIKELISAKKNFMVECIVTSESIRYLIETVAYLSSLGVSVLKIEPVHISKISRGNSMMMPSPKDFVDNFIKTIEYIQENNLKIKIDTGFFSKPSIDAYCYANGRNLIITPRGDITSCVEIVNRTDPFAEIMLYGSVLVKERVFKFNEIALSKLKTFHFNNFRKCSDCNLKLICGGGCPIRNLWDNGFPLRSSMYICQIEHSLIPKILFLVANNFNYSEILFDNAEIVIC